MSQLNAVRRAALEPLIYEDARYWISWDRHLHVLPMDLLNAWFEGWAEFAIVMDRTRVTRLIPPMGPGRRDPEVEAKIAEFLNVQAASYLSAAQQEWFCVPEDDAWEWLRLTSPAQYAWLCGPDGWFPAYRWETVGPYRVFRKARLDVNIRYEIGPETPRGFPVRATDDQGTQNHMWSSVEDLAQFCSPPEEQFWADLGGTST